MLTRDKLQVILRTLPRLTIGLVGDLFLDRYLHLAPGASEHSVETGLEAYQVERVRNSPGALGTVMNNLAALGAGMLVPVTAIGDDGHGYDLLREVRRLPVDPTHVLCLADRLTPTYTKPLRLGRDGRWEELSRLDVRTRAPLPASATAEISRRVADVFRTSDGLIVVDQLVDEDYGVVNRTIRDTLAELARQTPKKLIFVDSRGFLGRFSCGILKGNRSEVLAAAGGPRDVPSRQPLAECLGMLAERTWQPAYCTLGEEGILVAQAGREPQQLVAQKVAGPIDIVGAGDAATSGIMCALLAGADPLEAAEFGNLVASITIQQLGTTGTASPQQVLDQWGPA